MTEIRNLTFQPLTFHLAGDGDGIHLSSRGRVTIQADQLSDELRTAADRGFVSISDVSRSTQPDPRVDLPDAEHNRLPVSNDARTRKRRTR